MRTVVAVGTKVPPRSLRRHPERSEAEPKDPVELHGDATSITELAPAGITNDLEARVAQHVDGGGSGFTQRYRLSCLVYYESFPDPAQAIAREKQMKRWSRNKKVALISKTNPEFVDLAPIFRGTFPSANESHHEAPRGPSTALRSAQDDCNSGGSQLACHPERSAAGAQSKDPVESHGGAAFQSAPIPNKSDQRR